MSFINQSLVPPVSLTLDGKEYKLSYNLKSVYLYNEKTRTDKNRPETGDSLFTLGHWARVDNDPQRLIYILWAGLQANHPEMTVEMVEGLVNFTTCIPILQAIRQCLVAFLPAKKEEDAAETQDPNAQAANL